MAQVIPLRVLMRGEGFKGTAGQMAALGKTAQRTGRLLRAALGIAGVGGAAGVIRSIVRATQEQERVEAQVASRIRATGGAAGYTTSQLRAMAAEIQSVTTYGDEAVLGMQSLLLSFRNIQGATFERATTAILDLATGVGVDLRSAAIQLGKALNDPVIGLEALTRSGTTFSEAQKTLIKRLVEAGDLMGAQKVILDEVEAQYGGAARAARDTFGGAIQALSNAFGDLLEARGSLPQAQQEIEKLVSALSSVDTQNSVDAVITGVAKAAGALAENLQLLGQAAKVVAAAGAAYLAVRVQLVAVNALHATAIPLLSGVAARWTAAAASMGAAAAAGQALRVAVRGLGIAMRALGGPLGVILLAFEGLWIYRTFFRDVKEQVDLLQESRMGLLGIEEGLKTATGEQLKNYREMARLQKDQIRYRIVALEGEITRKRMELRSIADNVNAQREKALTKFPNQLDRSGRPLTADLTEFDVQAALRNDSRGQELASLERQLQGLVRQRDRIVKQLEDSGRRQRQQSPGAASSVSPGQDPLETLAKLKEQALPEHVQQVNEIRRKYDDLATRIRTAGLEPSVTAGALESIKALRSAEIAEVLQKRIDKVGEETKRKFTEDQQVAQRYADLLREGTDYRLTEYERDVAAVHRWKEETTRAARTAAERFGLSGAALTQEVAGRAAERLQVLREELDERKRLAAEEAAIEARRRALAESDSPHLGIREGLRRLTEDTRSAAEEWADVTEGAAQRMSASLTEFVRSGKLNFGSLVDYIIQESIRLSVVDPLIKGLAGALGNFFGGGSAAPIGPDFSGVAFYHRGGIVGEGPRRYHGGGIVGGAGAEVPAILTRGEGVFTPKQMAALAPAQPQQVEIRLLNQGAPKRAEVASQQMDGRTLVLGVLMQDLVERGDYSTALERTMGLRRVTT